jgi:hypothetical protein
MPSTYYLGTSPDEALGDSPRYFYAIRRNEDGELFLVRSDQLIDKDSIELNYPGDPTENFEEFEPGTDFFDGKDVDHELAYANIKYTQYRWDNRSVLYYVNGEGQLVQRINQNYVYPVGTSSSN